MPSSFGTFKGVKRPRGSNYEKQRRLYYVNVQTALLYCPVNSGNVSHVALEGQGIPLITFGRGSNSTDVFTAAHHSSLLWCAGVEEKLHNPTAYVLRGMKDTTGINVEYYEGLSLRREMGDFLSIEEQSFLQKAESAQIGHPSGYYRSVWDGSSFGGFEVQQASMDVKSALTSSRANYSPASVTTPEFWVATERSEATHTLFCVARRRYVWVKKVRIAIPIFSYNTLEWYRQSPENDMGDVCANSLLDALHREIGDSTLYASSSSAILVGSRPTEELLSLEEVAEDPRMLSLKTASVGSVAGIDAPSLASARELSRGFVRFAGL